MAAAAEAEELPDVPPVPAIEKLKTARGKPLIAVNGQYLMVQHKLTKDRTEMIWRCADYASGQYAGCKARGRSAAGSDNIAMVSAHSHRPVPEEIEKRKKLVEIERLAQEQLHVPTRQLVEQAFQGLSDAASAAMPDSPALAKRIERKRAPDDGGDVNGRPEEVRWNRRARETGNGQRFLLVDSRDLPGQADLPPFFVFASPTGIGLLRQIRVWGMDGTFYCTPRHARQSAPTRAQSFTSFEEFSAMSRASRISRRHAAGAADDVNDPENEGAD